MKTLSFLHFTTIPSIEANELKNDFSESPYYALLDIDNDHFTLYASQQISLSVSSAIENQIEQILEHKKLKQAGIDLQILEEASTTINITTKIIAEDGESNKIKS